MNYEVLDNLAFCTKKKWLWQYVSDEINADINVAKPYSQELNRLIQTNLAEMLALKADYQSQQARPKIAIADPDPIRFLAAMIAGVIAEIDLFLGDPAWQIQEWSQVIDLVSPALVFGDSKTKGLIATAQAGSNSMASQELNLPKQPLIMIPTGGTSGKIRFAMHSWSTLTASAKAFRAYFACEQNDFNLPINSFCTLPLYHVSGLMQFVRSFVTQGNLALCPYKIAKTQTVSFANLTNQSEFFISLVPTQLQSLIQSAPHWLAEFKTVLLGGAPPGRSLLDQARKYNIPIALTYGMTETASGIVTLKPQDFLAGNNSSGKALPHTQMTIEPETKQTSENRIGLLKISCSSLCKGYYPKTFTQAFITDDLGYFDQHNYLHLIGRNSQKIITGGKNVFPAEVEAAIWATELVQDICVVGVSDIKWGQAVTAIYIPLKSKTGSKPNLALLKQEIKLQLAQQLAKYKLPKHWIQVDAIPRNNRGKVNYQALQAIAQEAIENN